MEVGIGVSKITISFGVEVKPGVEVLYGSSDMLGAFFVAGDAQAEMMNIQVNSSLRIQ